MRKIEVTAQEISENPGRYKICRNCGAKNLKVNNLCHNCRSEFFEKRPSNVKTIIDKEIAESKYSKDGDFRICVADEDQRKREFEDVY